MPPATEISLMIAVALAGVVFVVILIREMPWMQTEILSLPQTTSNQAMTPARVPPPATTVVPVPSQPPTNRWSKGMWEEDFARYAIGHIYDQPRSTTP